RSSTDICSTGSSSFRSWLPRFSSPERSCSACGWRRTRPRRRDHPPGKGRCHNAAFTRRRLPDLPRIKCREEGDRESSGALIHGGPMLPRLRIPQTVSFPICVLTTLLLTTSCHESSSSPTSPSGSAMVLGTIVRGSGTFGATTLGAGMGLPGVTVRVVRTGRSAQTDTSGNFSLTGVPVGNVDMEFSRADINARASVQVSPGTNAITVAVTGSTAVVVPRGHAGEEIEGLVSAVSTGAGTLTVLDQRLGAVVVKTTSTTVLRHGQTTMTLSQIQIGMRVHVKALLQ